MQNDHDIAPWWVPPLCGLIAFVVGIGVLASLEAKYARQALPIENDSLEMPANTCGPELRR